MKSILVVNGPNLNMLGQREPEVYGHETLEDIENSCKAHGLLLGFNIDFVQSNIEGKLVEAIHSAISGYSAVIINAGAYTHTSIALMDALLMLKVPVIEVHMSNIFRREAFRHESYIAKAASGVICGFGRDSYILAIDAVSRIIGGGKK